MRTPKLPKPPRVTFDPKRLAQLEMAEKERDDYYQAMRLMRERAVYVQDRAKEGSQWAEGWLAGQMEWAQVLLQVMGARE